KHQPEDIKNAYRKKDVNKQGSVSAKMQNYASAHDRDTRNVKPSEFDERWQKGGIFESYTPADELLEYRTKFSKTFKNPDGTYTTQLSGLMHYKDENGVWQDVSYDITNNNSKGFSEYKYANTTAEIKSWFAGTPGQTGMKMSYKDFRFSFWQNPQMFLMDNGNIVYAENAKQVHATVNDNVITFPNIYPGIDQEFQVMEHGRGIKDNLVIEALNIDYSKKRESIQLEFCQFVPLNEACNVLADGQVQNDDFTAEKFSIRTPDFAEGFVFNPVVAFDDKIENSNKAMEIIKLAEDKPEHADVSDLDNVVTGTYRIEFVEGGIKVFVSLPYKWFLDDKRSFPLTVDPSVTVGSEEFDYNVLWNGYYCNTRLQALYLSSTLSDAGLPDGAEITAVELYADAVNCSNTHTGLKIRIKETASDNTTDFENTGYTNCYSGSVDVNATGWHMHNFSTNFVFSSENLLIDFTMNMDDYLCVSEENYWNTWTSTGWTEKNCYKLSYSSCTEDPQAWTDPTVDSDIPYIRFTYNMPDTCDITSLDLSNCSPQPNLDSIYYFDVCQGDDIVFEASADCADCAETPDYSWTINAYDGNGETVYEQNPLTYTVDQASGYDGALNINGGNCMKSYPFRIRSSAGPDVSPVTAEISGCSGASTDITVGGETDEIEVDAFLGEITPTLDVGETTFIPDGPNCTETCYQSTLTFSDFAVNSEIDNPEDILYLNINMEHTFIGDLEITLKGPNDCGSAILLPGKQNVSYDWPYSIVLFYCEKNAANSYFLGYGVLNEGTWEIGNKEDATVFASEAEAEDAVLNNNYGASVDCPESQYDVVYSIDIANIAFGIPNVDDFGDNPDPCDSEILNNAPGTGWDYCWSNNPDYSYAGGTNSYVYEPENVQGYDPDSASYAFLRVNPSNMSDSANFYHPYEGFNNLVGCPLNGTWTIEVCDTWELDNGWIFEWELAFDPDLLPVNWDYTVDIDSVDWSEVTDASFDGTYPNYELIPEPGLSSGDYTGTFTVYDGFDCSAQENITYSVEGIPDITGIQTGDYVWSGYVDGNWDNATNDNWMRKTDTGYENADNTPDASSNVFIVDYCSTSTWPGLTDDIYCHDLTILSGELSIGTNQTLYVGGDFDNQASFNANNETVVFNGSSLQTVNAGGNNFYNLKTDNSGDGIQLNSDIVTENELNMVSGNIDCSGNLLSLGTSTAVPGSLQHTSGAVFGQMKRWFSGSTNSGAATGLFPLGYSGVGTEYLPLMVEYTSAPSSGGTLTAEFDSTSMGTAPAGINIPAAGACDAFEVASFSSEGYWEVTPGDGISGGTYDITLYPNGFSDISDICELTALKRSGTDWEQHGTNSEPQGTIAEPVVKRTGVSTGFSDWGIGKGPTNTLPIELLSFTAKCTGDNITINWTTASETNNDYFILEKSRDMDDFVEIARIEGQGFSSTNIEYIYDDSLIFSGYNYYRLTQVDFDGEKESFAPIHVNCENSNDGESRILVYPNPFCSEINIFMENINDDVIWFELYDGAGQVIYSDSYTIMENTQSHCLKLNELEPGIYFLKSVTETLTFSKKIVKIEK
ncbi:MAG: T9SS type A sorting domain-containing protein, partial [Bacteroidales bacterium]